MLWFAFWRWLFLNLTTLTRITNKYRTRRELRKLRHMFIKFFSVNHNFSKLPKFTTFQLPFILFEIKPEMIHWKVISSTQRNSIISALECVRALSKKTDVSLLIWSLTFWKVSFYQFIWHVLSQFKSCYFMWLPSLF